MSPNVLSEINLNKICYACLGTVWGMVNIGGEDEKSRTLRRYFNEITGIEYTTYNATFNICTSCEGKLNAAASFRDQCKKSSEVITQHCTKQELQTVNEIKIDDELALKSNKSEFIEEATSEAVDVVIGAITDGSRDTRVHFRRSEDSVNCTDKPCCGMNGDVVGATPTEECNISCTGVPKSGSDDDGVGCIGGACCTGSDDNDSDCSYVDIKEEKRFWCKECNISFESLDIYQTHVKGHKSQPFKCDSCKLSFDTRLDMRKHVKEKHREKSEPQNFCPICNKKVRSLHVHNKEVHQLNGDVAGNAGKLCSVCGKTFKNNSRLVVHMRGHTGETPYACEFCDRRMSSRSNMILHMRTHTGERPHVCHVCGKGFAQSSVLNTHMRLHNGKTETCHICSKSFCRPAELRLHMRGHTGEKPFRCRTCGQAFIQQSHLKGHEATHRDERPFICRFCNRGFKQRSTLKSHEQIHLGSKPFRCSQCFYSCRQSYSLTQHMKQHSQDSPQPGNPHACALCSKTFSTLAMLSSHNDSAHNSAPIQHVETVVGYVDSI